MEFVLDAQASLGEGPVWDAKTQRLYWVDIALHNLHIYDPKSHQNKTIHVGQFVGAVVPHKSGGAVVALQHGFYQVDLDHGGLTELATVETDLPSNRFNDGKCDSSGRFWAGTMDMNETQPMGSLYCLDHQLNLRKVLSHVTVSNGLAWSPDDKKMYYIDTPTRQVVAFEYDYATGSISNRSVAVQIPEGKGYPDGMTIDSQGMIWVAHWDGGQVSRWNPATGQLLDEIPVPAQRVTSCAFGGPHLDELYITTARIGLDEPTLRTQPHAGGIFRLKTAVKGLPSYPFGN